MRYRKLTPATATSPGGDYSFGHDQQDFFINTPAGVAQAVQTALLLHQGEWFLDVTVGMPWETQVLGYNTQSLYDGAIRTLVLGVQGVKAITSYSSSLNKQTRLLTVNMTIATIYGPVSITVPVSIVGGYGISPYGGPTVYNYQ